MKRLNNPEDRVGEVYGRLTITSYSHTKELGKNKKRYFNCVCVCGKTTTSALADLRVGKVNSCGCFSKEVRSLKNGEAAFNKVWSSYKNHARRRNYSFNLTKEEFKTLVQENCDYCGAEPSNVFSSGSNTGKYTYNGIDRVENSQGYSIDNCVPCCKTCNYAKQGMSKSEFLSWVERVHLHKS